jgi:hypothetical protein
LEGKEERDTWGQARDEKTELTTIRVQSNEQVGRHPNFPASNSDSNPLHSPTRRGETALRELFRAVSQKGLKSTRRTLFKMPNR